jgi:hypothetical protein
MVMRVDALVVGSPRFGVRVRRAVEDQDEGRPQAQLTA